MPGKFRFFELVDKKFDSDTMHINKTKKSISASLSAFRFIDKDTKQVVIHFPSLDISGYGETEQKAIEIAQFSLNEFFVHIIHLSPDKLQKELSSYGWKKDPYHNKDYSSSYVDNEGALQNFNALEGSVKRINMAVEA